MRFFFKPLLLALITLAGLLINFRSHAQGFLITCTNPPAATSLGSTLIYNYTITNTGGAFITQFDVTNQFSQNVTFLAASNSYPTNEWVFVTNNNAGLYAFIAFNTNDTISFSLAVQPSAPGFLTNTVTAIGNVYPIAVTTNIVTLIYSSTSDLGVSITPPVQAVVTNDITSYSVSITNLGPQTATGVVLTNTLPPGVILKGVSPSSPGYTLSTSNMIFNIGTLSANAGQTFNIFIQPTNVETATLSASIGSATALDTNLVNNFVTTNVTFSGYLPGTLVAFTNSAQAVNLQNGTIEQSIVVSNAGTINVPSVRVVVTGLTNLLFNAVGTNGGNPFIEFSNSLAVGQSVAARLQYLPRNAFVFSNGQLHAFAVTPPNWTPPWFGAAISAVTNINIRRIVEMPDGEMLLEFPTTTTKTYTIVYSDNILFSNAMMAVPSIVAPANAVQWDDYGPPETVSFPTNSAMRFYRIYQNP